LADYLALDLEKVTKLLLETGVGTGNDAQSFDHNWMGKGLEELRGEEFDPAHVDCYHGDFKRSV
jgi:hypothetical protein